MREASRKQARHYARALFQVARKEGAEETTRLRTELGKLVGLLNQSAELRSAVEHPGLTPEARGRALQAITEGAGGSELLGLLLGLLADRGHLGLLSAISEAFTALVNAAEGIVSVRATGAVVLTAEQERALALALEGTTGAQVELTAEVDPMALGGLQVTVGGKTYDGTVRAQLAALRRRLASGS